MDAIDRALRRLIVFSALGIAPIVLAGEALRAGHQVLAIFGAFYAGALVWWASGSRR